MEENFGGRLRWIEMRGIPLRGIDTQPLCNRHTVLSVTAELLVLFNAPQQHLYNIDLPALRTIPFLHGNRLRASPRWHRNGLAREDRIQTACWCCIRHNPAWRWGHGRARHSWKTWIQQIGDGTSPSVSGAESWLRGSPSWPFQVVATDLSSCCLRDLITSVNSYTTTSVWWW